MRKATLYNLKPKHENIGKCSDSFLNGPFTYHILLKIMTPGFHLDRYTCRIFNSFLLLIHYYCVYASGCNCVALAFMLGTEGQLLGTVCLSIVGCVDGTQVTRLVRRELSAAE